jgi:hypothetical protein
LFERDELGRIVWTQGRRREGKQDGAEKGYALDLAEVRIGLCEDWLEDARKVERVERRSKG